MKTHRTNRTPSLRRGSVLYVVLVIIALLTLAAYQFSEIMLLESTASDQATRRVQARAYADSGVEAVLELLRERKLVTSDNVVEENLYANPMRFHGIIENAGAENPRIVGRFSVIAPVEADPECRQFRFGLADESGKLNLNSLLTLIGNGDDAADRARYVLLDMELPGMTYEVADAILDWLDQDVEIRQYGAEEPDYASLGYAPTDGPLLSLDELLLVRGVTPAMVFGFDRNRNGILDPQESAEADAAGAQTPAERLGWSAYFTVHSKELNVGLSGDEKINVNNGVLADLYDRLEAELADAGVGDSEEIATFIVAYRMYGAVPTEEEEEEGSNSSKSQPLASGNSATPSQGGGGGGTQLNQEAVKKMATGVAKTIAKSGGNSEEAVTRNGLDLSGGAKVMINSLYELVDVEVELDDGKMLQSPWTSDNLAEVWPAVLDRLTTTDNKYIQGRVNVNQARMETLMGVISAVDGYAEDRNLAVELADRILANKMIDDNGNPLSNVMAAHQSTAWLVTEGHVTIQQMRQLDRYLTTRGDVYRAQVIGFFDEGGPVTRLEVIFDATHNPPRIRFQRDLTELGKGFTPQSLIPGI